MNINREVDWQNALNSVKKSYIFWIPVYSIEYKTLDPGCNLYKIDITSSGYIKDYRCSGK